MAKFHGAIGFAKVEEDKPGVWVDKIVEREYAGEMWIHPFDCHGTLCPGHRKRNQRRV